MQEKNNILNELKEQAELLHQIKLQEKEVVVPNQYFDLLADTIWNKIELETETPSVLQAINKKKVEDIPNNYFENFYASLDLPKTKVVAISKSRFSFKHLSIAASIIGIFFLGLSFIIKQNNTNTSYNALLNEVTTSDIQNYVANNLYDFEPSDVQTVFNTNLDSIKLLAVNTKTIEPIETTVAIKETNIHEDIDVSTINAIDANSIKEYIEDNPATFDYYDDETYIF
ncbi:MAG: hypothetical protein H6553_11130 [Chitinophagales bacterium]|nr:hypothetical protein [Chitinophagales bacterium]